MAMKEKLNVIHTLFNIIVGIVIKIILTNTMYLKSFNVL